MKQSRTWIIHFVAWLATIKLSSLPPRAFVVALSALAVVASTVTVTAQPELYLRAVQSSTGALFLTAGPNAWPVVPDQIGDADLAALSRESEIDGAFPAGPLLIPPRPQMIVQGSDGTLYLVHGVAAWPLVPDQITDSDLAALNLGSEIDGTIPSGLGTGVAAPLPGSRSG